MEKLTPEQIKELNEISQLPQNQQQERLQEFLGKLSEEQIEYLKGQQQQTCPFCSIIFGDIAAKQIYVDNKVMAVLDINPANVGHFIVFPREHVKTSFDMNQEDFMYLMNVTNILAKKMASMIKATGFNIIISNGTSAGQRSEHFLIHAIPRFEKDGITLDWKSKGIDEKMTKAILNEFNSFRIVEKNSSKQESNEESYYEEERIP